MPGASQGLIPYILLVLGALGSFIAAAGLIYWAIHNSAKGVREEMREGDRLLREEMREGNRLLREEIREGDQLLRGEIREGDQLLREEMREGNRLLREEMREGFRRLEDLLMSHQHDAQGYPYATYRPRDND